MSLTTFKNRKWQRQRNDNDAYLEDLNQIVDQVNALPGTSTVLGYFATLADLITAYPAGANGQFGIVGNTIYIWDPITSAWITIGDTLYKGVLDASAGIPYPAAQVGEFWRISVAGVIGTTQVEVGDQVICIAAYAGGMDDTKFMIVQTNVQVTSVTYAQLTTLINNAGLEPGRQYLISDYVTAFNLFDGGTNTVVANEVGSQEPLLVKAVTTSTLDRVAQSWLYPQDIIYYNPYASAVDRAAFIAAGDVGYIDGGDVVPNFNGVIEFRHDTKQNVSTWYDFRNVKFRRWAVDAGAYDNDTVYVPQAVCKSGVDGKIYKCLTFTIGGGDPTVNTADWILWLDIVSDAYVSWTSNKTKFNIYNINTDNLIFIPATYQDVYTFGSWYNHVNDVTIGHNNLTLLIDNGYNTTLNNIVFKTTDDIYTCYSNEIGEVSYNNTIGNSFFSNIIGNSFFSNIIGNNFSSNIIGNNFSSNIIGNEFLRNTVGNDFYSNIIGNNSSSNIIGNNFLRNTVGNEFLRNTIGNEFSDNTIGNEFLRNTIGNGFLRNTIGNGFLSNIIGNNSSSNIIENDFSYNIIGNSFSSNTIGNGFFSNTIWDDFYLNTIENGFSYNTIGNNSKVSAGINCKGNSIGDFNAQVTLGDNCTGISVGEKNETITLGATNTDISIGNGNPTITIEDNCTNLTFQNGCTFSGNTKANGLQNCLFESGTNITATDFDAATHIKAAYNKTVFMNATPAVKLSYFDASNALTVDDVNA